MGCSLCSLQKQEEQYKLLYEVCQVMRGVLRRQTGEARTCPRPVSRGGIWGGGGGFACVSWVLRLPA